MLISFRGLTPRWFILGSVLGLKGALYRLQGRYVAVLFLSRRTLLRGAGAPVDGLMTR